MLEEADLEAATGCSTCIFFKGLGFRVGREVFEVKRGVGRE